MSNGKLKKNFVVGQNRKFYTTFTITYNMVSR